MNRCPYCNWDMNEGCCSNWMQCDYRGPGLTPQQINEQARGYQLGQLSRNDTDNGDGRYDHDTDFS